MQEDRTIPFGSDDPDMSAAIDTARQTIEQFLDAFFSPKDGQTAFLLKVRFADGDQVEHVWVADLEVTESTFRGVIANEPRLSTLRFKQTVEFEPRDVTDWMFLERGKLIGGYTTRLVRQRMSAGERDAFDASVPYSF